MKYFKIVASRSAKRYRIDVQTFKSITDNRYPYVKSDGSTIRRYGICPSCLNPIQLIGIARQTEIKPYGKHAGKGIKDLAEWDIIKYRYCPYAIKNYRKHPEKNTRLPVITEEVRDLYELLKTQFDRVIYVVSKELNIRCSFLFWRKALQQYLLSKMYCYPWLTETNLPYLFAYEGITQKNIYGQSVLVNSDIFHALSKYEHIRFKPTADNRYVSVISDGTYVKLVFRLTDHRQDIDENGELIESMRFCIDDIGTISVSDTAGVVCKTLYDKKIIFKESYFMNIIHKYGAYRNRRQDYLNLAAQMMPPLHLTE